MDNRSRQGRSEMGVSVRLTAIDVSDFALPASRRSVLGRGTHAPRAHRVVVMCLQSGARLGRCFVHTVGLFAALCMVQAQPVTAQSELVKSTVAYREVEGHKILADVYCSAPGFLDSSLKVITSTLPRPARRNRVALGLDSDSRTSPASTARCTSVETRARRGGVPRSFRSSAPTRDSP